MADRGDHREAQLGAPLLLCGLAGDIDATPTRLADALVQMVRGLAD